MLSDPGSQPLAYHLFSTILLEQIFRADPSVFDPASLAVREQAGNFALSLMAPDGQLTHSGRSAEQSWVLAAAADLGALRAREGGPLASAWRAFAERAMTRLTSLHGTFADGTIPVVPGLLDLPEPWRVVKHAETALHAGGILLAYLPTIGQVARLREELAGSAFGMVETLEVLQRTWHVDGQSVRPDHRMVAHTGFLTHGRLLAPET